MGKITRQTFYIIAGEHSGDIFASNLVRALKNVYQENYPDIELQFAGLGGSNLKKEGVVLMENIVDNLAIIGIVEVLINFTKFYSLFKRIEKRFKEDPPDGVILVDYPGFNLKIAGLAKKYGIPVYYYVCPQVWAWREKRITEIVNNVDELFTIFEFEPSVIKQSRYFPEKCSKECNIHFIGHPLLDILKEIKLSREEIHRNYEVDSSKRLIGLLPGSRSSEVKRLLPVMLRSAKKIKSLYKDVEFVIPVASTVGKTIIDLHLQQENMTKDVKIVSDDEYNLRSTLDFAIVASGTATLELSFLEIPMVIIYKINSLGYFIAKRLVNIKNIGLVNIIFGEQLVPECIQDAANEDLVSRIVIEYLTNSDKLQKIRSKLQGVKKKVLPDPEIQEKYHSKSPSLCTAKIIMERQQSEKKD